MGPKTRMMRTNTILLILLITTLFVKAQTAQTILFPSIPVMGYGDASFTLNATASSGLAISYVSSNIAVATVSGSTVTIKTTGNTVISAYQVGNASFAPATPVPQLLVVCPKATLTVTADNKSAESGATLPALTFVVSGFKKSETSTVVSGAPTFESLGTNLAAGTYPIVVNQGTLAATNYEFQLINGLLTIQEASLLLYSKLADDAVNTIDLDKTVNQVVGAPGAKITLNSGKTLQTNVFTLQSDETNGTSTFLNNGTLTATVANVQQYLTAGRNWYVSSPVAAATTAALSSATTVLSYNEPTATWTTETGLLSPMKGYASVTTTSNGAITFSGTLNDGDQTRSLTRTEGFAKPGFNLVGNPYPSYVNWDLAEKTNLEPTMWYRSINAGKTAYVFDTYNAVGHLGTGNNGTQVNSNIPPMQAFWVRVTPNLLGGNNTGSLTFRNAMRSHKGSQTANSVTIPDVKLRAATPQNAVSKVLRLQVSNSVNSDEAIVLFNPNATNQLDAYDSYKMSNSNPAVPEIYTIVGTEPLVINGLNGIETVPFLPLGFTTDQENTFTIKATEVSNLDGVSIVLRDNLLAKQMVLSTGSAYAFTSTATSTNSRFSLLISASSPVGICKQATLSNVHVFCKSGHLIVQSSKNAFSAYDQVTVYHSTGQKLAGSNLTGTSTELDSDFAPGVYLVNLRVNGELQIEKVIVK